MIFKHYLVFLWKISSQPVFLTLGHYFYLENLQNQKEKNKKEQDIVVDDSNFVVLAKMLSLHKSQFPYIWNEDNTGGYLILLLLD